MTAISVVLPAPATRAEIVRRTLHSLAEQTLAAHLYEVIVVAEGGDDGRLAKVVEAAAAPNTRLIASPRPCGDVPHRNHARNAGACVARGRLIWPLDCDFILPPSALREAVTEFDHRLTVDGKPTILTPVMVQIANGKWTKTKSPSTAALPIDRRDAVFNGFADLYDPDGPKSRAIPKLDEGMPIIPREIFEALGGFSEDFVGWGGNKEELVNRVVGLVAAGALTLRCLTGVRIYHQPHARCPTKGDARKNQMMRERRQQEIQRRAKWWAEQEDRGVAAAQVVRRAQPVVACMAAVPWRSEILRKVVATLLPQVDELRIYLNGWSDVPGFLEHERVEAVLDKDAAGDLGDVGKFYWCESVFGYLFTVDDDIYYPADYVDRLVRSIETYGRRAVVGVHAATMVPPVRNYYKSRRQDHCRGALDADKAVHVLGTGTMAYHTDTVTVRRADFELPNMADVFMARIGQRQKTPFIALSRNKDWIRPENNTGASIYGRGDSSGHQARIARAVDWQIHSVDVLEFDEDRDHIPVEIEQAVRYALRGPMRRGRGVDVLVVGRWSGRLAQVVSSMGGNARVVTDAPGGQKAGALLAIDALGDDGRRRAFAHCLRRKAAVVLLERTRQNDKAAPAPLIYQRQFPGISCRGLHHVGGGESLTLFNGRLTNNPP